MSLGDLYIMRPEWLWALLPALGLAVLLWFAGRRSGSWQEVIEPSLLPYLIAGEEHHSRPRTLPWIIIAWCLACVALSGPSLRQLPQPVQQRAEALVIALDLSLSMKAQDLAPSRLDRARQKVLDLLAQRQEGQTALIAYAGDAHVVTPLTDDKQTIANLLPALNPDMMPIPGSDTLAAVEAATELLLSGASGTGRLLLITDAVAQRYDDAIAALLTEQGISLTVLGVGTDSGAPIPMPQGGFLRDAQGAIVMPRLAGDRLRQFAAASGGRYLPLSLDDRDLEAIANPPPAAQETLLEAQGRRADQWLDQGYLLVLILLPFAAALFRRGWLLCLLPLLMVAQPRPANAQDIWDSLWLNPHQRAQKALDAGEPERAAELFEDPEWAATARYQAGDFDIAADLFGAQNDSDAWYNRGNALARSGDLEAAVKAYETALQQEPGAEDAQHNLELLETLLDQQQQEQQDGDQQGQQSQQEDDQSTGDQGQQAPSAEQDKGGQDNQNKQAQNKQPGQDDPPATAPTDKPDSSDHPGQEPEAPPSSEESPGEPDSAEADNDPAQAEAAQASQMPAEPGEAEQDQALDQWLRRVPDDPSGLLREKFHYESRQRRIKEDQRDNDTYW